MTLGFPRASLRQSRSELNGTTLVVSLDLGGEGEGLRLAARIGQLVFDDGPRPAPAMARITLDFLLLRAPDRARIQGALIGAARSGRWLGGEPTAEHEADRTAGAGAIGSDALDERRRSA